MLGSDSRLRRMLGLAFLPMAVISSVALLASIPLRSPAPGYRAASILLHVVGGTLARMGMASHALRFHRKGVHLAPSGKGYHALARIREDLGQTSSAVEGYRAAIRIDDRRANWFMDLARAHGRLRQVPEAIAALEAAIALEPSQVDAHLQLARLLGKTGRWSQAVVACRTAIENEPGSATAHAMLGRCLSRSGSVEEAIDATRKALASDSSNASWFVQLGALLERLDVGGVLWTRHLGLVRAPGDLAAAADAYMRAAVLEPENHRHYLRLGGVLERIRDWPGAAAAYDQAVRLAPGLAGSWFRLGRVHEFAADLRRAVAAYKVALDLDDDHRGAMSRSATAYTKLGRWAEASRAAAAVTSGASSLAEEAKESSPRSGQQLANDLTALLEGPPDELTEDGTRQVFSASAGNYHLLPEAWWLTLHWRLVERGWFTIAYDVKRRLAEATGADSTARLRTTGLARFLNVARAIAYLGNDDEAVAYLRSGLVEASTALENQAIRKVCADLEAAAGDFSGATALLDVHSGVNSSAVERSFAELIGGHSVAIVGPAETDLLNGEEIDGFDVVVRPHFVSEHLQFDTSTYGSRTDVSYYNDTASRHMESEIRAALTARHLRTVVLRTVSYRQGREYFASPGDLRFIPSEYRGVFRASQFGVPRMVYDILRYEPSRLKIFNVDFFVNEKEYREGYKVIDADFSFRGYGHDFLADFIFIRRLEALGLIEGDAVARHLLAWSPERYLRELDRKSESDGISHSPAG